MTAKERNNNTISTDQIILNEYDNLWRYYISSVEERFKLFDWYFKIVTLPFAILGGLTPFLKPNMWIYLPFAFFLIFLCGFCINILYGKQSAQSKKYDVSLKLIRNHFISRYSSLENIIILDRLRKKRYARNIYNKDINTKITLEREIRSIKFWRGLIISLFNSAIFVVALISHRKVTLLIFWYIPIFIGILVIQLFCYYISYRNFLGKRNWFCNDCVEPNDNENLCIFCNSQINLNTLSKQ